MGLKKDIPKKQGAPQTNLYKIRLKDDWGAFSLSCLSVIQTILLHFYVKFGSRIIIFYFTKNPKNTFVDARRRSVRDFSTKNENNLSIYKKIAIYSVFEVLFYSNFCTKLFHYP